MDTMIGVKFCVEVTRVVQNCAESGVSPERDAGGLKLLNFVPRGTVIFKFDLLPVPRGT